MVSRGRRAGQGRGGDSFPHAEREDFITIEVEADGFLYNMVRAMVGTLVEVGRGARPETWPGEVLAAQNRRAAGPTAPPQGLFLVRVELTGRQNLVAHQPGASRGRAGDRFAHAERRNTNLH